MSSSGVIKLMVFIIILTFMSSFTAGVFVGKQSSRIQSTIKPVKIECYEHPRYNPDLLIRTSCRELKIE